MWLAGLFSETIPIQSLLTTKYKFPQTLASGFVNILSKVLFLLSVDHIIMNYDS